jgi:hypothetical protein
MGTIEDTLRETFAAEVAAPPALEGVADRAIGQARRVRQTRMGVVTAAAMVAVALTGGVAAALHGGNPVKTPPAGSNALTAAVAMWPEAVRVDLLVGDQIRTPEGLRIPLAETAAPLRAYRVGDRWLVEGQDVGASEHSLWDVQSDGTTRRLLSGYGVTVSPDGLQVAWATGDLLKVADLVDGRLINERRTGGRRGLVPYAFAGEAVLLTAQDYVYKGTGTPPFDLWFPSRGAYVPGPTPKHAVYGMGLAPGGARMLGMAAVGPPGPGGRAYCLAELNTETLEPTRYACGMPISPVATLAMAPDGRHALITSDERLLLIDLDRVYDQPLVSGEWPAAWGAVAWLDADTAVVGLGSELTMIKISAPRDKILVPLPDVTVQQPAQAIPRLR